MTVEAQSPSLAAMDSRESVAQPAVAEESGAYIRDTDPEETAEWIESLDSVIDETGPDRARLLITRLLQRARERHSADCRDNGLREHDPAREGTRLSR